ncbi:hypothetical protein MG293_018649 [Ovis ammon polii]|uniref:Uncharacterized protein n=1 Tax=Ovis ammon polii TaxID=230172 RepID=A0AAD4TQB9_OVIAM|nr:hypothetical protein MG293_018649 [Ovis ammon polii]
MVNAVQTWVLAALCMLKDFDILGGKTFALLFVPAASNILPEVVWAKHKYINGLMLLSQYKSIITSEKMPRIKQETRLSSEYVGQSTLAFLYRQCYSLQPLQFGSLFVIIAGTTMSVWYAVENSSSGRNWMSLKIWSLDKHHMLLAFSQNGWQPLSGPGAKKLDRGCNLPSAVRLAAEHSTAAGAQAAAGGASTVGSLPVWMEQLSSLSADKTARKGSKLHAQAAHVYPKVQALLSFVSYACKSGLHEYDFWNDVLLYSTFFLVFFLKK